QLWSVAERFGFLSLMNYHRPLVVLRDGAWPWRDIAVLLGVGGGVWAGAGGRCRASSLPAVISPRFDRLTARPLRCTIRVPSWWCSNAEHRPVLRRPRPVGRSRDRERRNRIPCKAATGTRGTPKARARPSFPSSPRGRKERAWAS